MATDTPISENEFNDKLNLLEMERDLVELDHKYKEADYVDQINELKLKIQNQKTLKQGLERL